MARIAKKTTTSEIENFINVLDQVKAINIKTFDLTGINPCFDFVLIASGSSRAHVRGISDKLIKNVSQKALSIEGVQEYNWVLLDYSTVIIHIFLDEIRSEYDLEGLYQDLIDNTKQQLNIQLR